MDAGFVAVFMISIPLDDKCNLDAFRHAEQIAENYVF